MEQQFDHNSGTKLLGELESSKNLIIELQAKQILIVEPLRFQGLPKTLTHLLNPLVMPIHSYGIHGRISMVAFPIFIAW